MIRVLLLGLAAYCHWWGNGAQHDVACAVFVTGFLVITALRRPS